MRKFTKEHNSLSWLYPDILNDNKNIKRSGEERFDEYEKYANYLFSVCYEDKETFSKDDIIDAFMKGTSVAHQTMISDFNLYISILKMQYEEEIKKLKDKLEDDK